MGVLTTLLVYRKDLKLNWNQRHEVCTIRDVMQMWTISPPPQIIRLLIRDFCSEPGPGHKLRLEAIMTSILCPQAPLPVLDSQHP